MQIRTDTPEKVFRPIPEAILPGENFLVCYRNGSQEIIVQSDRSATWAERSVEILNEHEEQNARPPKYYWRPRKGNE